MLSPGYPIPMGSLKNKLASYSAYIYNKTYVLNKIVDVDVDVDGCGYGYGYIIYIYILKNA